MLETLFGWFTTRPLRFIGGFLVFLSIGLLLFFVLVDIIIGLGNPYLGILVYLIMPIMLIIGLILVPLDSWIQRRRAARGETAEFVIDLCNPTQRKVAGFFAIASVVVLIVMSVVTYRAIEYMATTDFCGRVCHRVMDPEFVAHQRSAHASVSCVECHIGPGAPWFVRSKLTGVPQVWHYTLGDYDRPLETPVPALRPSRDTCENCHWPEQFYGSSLRTAISYEPDRENTRTTSTMIMHVGSGRVRGSGIHGHIVSRIEYLPAVSNLSEIAWVRVTRPDGATQEFVNPAYEGDLSELRQQRQVRLMDCIDCHNRAAHHFPPFEELLDHALTLGEVDPTLPFIKTEAMEAVGEIESPPTEAEQTRTVRRIREIDSFYSREFPDLYRSQREQVRRSVRAIEAIYLNAAFPHMRVSPATYPDWRTHAGCFRCHGTMEASDGNGEPAISADCGFCHTLPVTGEPSGLLTGQ